MNIATTVEQAKQTVRQWKAEGLTVGLVPTMGYLHEGHESLIKRAVAECDRVMVSVFLNPIQFAPNEDLATYPRDFAADTVLIENAGADLVFHPEPSELYAPDACTFVNVEEITSELCGKTRPTHFRGVCTVVSKLMNISQADRAYFGQKDAQQLAVVRAGGSLGVILDGEGGDVQGAQALDAAVDAVIEAICDELFGRKG